MQRNSAGFVDVISLLETFVLGTIGFVISFTSAHPTPMPPEVQSASIVAEISPVISTDELVMGPIIEDIGHVGTQSGVLHPLNFQPATVSPPPRERRSIATHEVPESLPYFQRSVISSQPSSKPTPRIPTLSPQLSALNSQSTTVSPPPRERRSVATHEVREPLPYLQRSAISPQPSATSTPSHTPKSSPTIRLTPTIATYTPVSSSTATLSQVNLNSEKIFQLINDHRRTKNLPAFEKHDYLCKVAEDRGPELYNEIFGDRYVHQGLYDRKLPYWITENMAHYNTEEKIFNWWMNSSLHRRSIEGNYKYSCGVCKGNSCAQLFTNFVER